MTIVIEKTSGKLLVNTNQAPSTSKQ